MPKFRKKPVVIEAWFNTDDGEPVPVWVDQHATREAGGAFLIHTLEGIMRADPGDWIIQGVKGEVYPCKADIFDATYEPVNPPIKLPRSDSGKYPPEVAHMLETGRAVVRDAVLVLD